MEEGAGKDVELGERDDGSENRDDGSNGGGSSMEDLENLQRLEASGVDQVIIGKAFYDGRIDMAEALSC